MGREIKFRGWFDNGVESEMMSGTNAQVFKWIEEGQPVAPLQYTGLKDKNGTEIYEGDILALDNENARSSYHIYKIEYNDDKARFIGVDGGDISYMPAIVNHHDGAGRYMVIGNIYENPELLEGSE